VGTQFFHTRLKRALKLREQAYPSTTHCRLTFSESDGLPGTIIDRYQDVLTWTCVSAGMEQRRDILLEYLKKYLNPQAIIERNDTPLRTKENLPTTKGLLWGTYQTPPIIEEEGLYFEVDVLNGPSTSVSIGWPSVALLTISECWTYLQQMVGLACTPHMLVPEK